MGTDDGALGSYSFRVGDYTPRTSSFHNAVCGPRATSLRSCHHAQHLATIIHMAETPTSQKLGARPERTLAIIEAYVVRLRAGDSVLGQPEMVFCADQTRRKLGE